MIFPVGNGTREDFDKRLCVFGILSMFIKRMFFAPNTKFVFPFHSFIPRGMPSLKIAFIKSSIFGIARKCAILSFRAWNYLKLFVTPSTFSIFSFSLISWIVGMFDVSMNAWARNDLQISYSIVFLVPVLMMYYFAKFKKSIQILFNNKSMFRNISLFATIRVIPNFSIPIPRTKNSLTNSFDFSGTHHSYII